MKSKKHHKEYTIVSLEKTLRTSIKIAGVVLTAPATLRVAARPYQDAPLLGAIIALSALVLVEGAMLLGWHLLDTKTRAAPQARTLYATTAIVGYFALWAIAYGNNEGLTGIAFRLTLGVAIAFSVVESGVLAGVRLRNRMYKQIPSEVFPSRRVRRDYIRKVEVSERRLNDRRVGNRERQESERLSGVHKGAIRDIRREHREPSTTEGNGNLSYPVEVARGHRRQNARTRREEAIGRMADALRTQPDMGATELADVAGIARSTVYKYIDDARSLVTNGHAR